MPAACPCYVREALPAFLAEEDPCQRLAARGAEALHTVELLSVVIGGNPHIASRLLETTPLAEIATLPVADLSPRLTPSKPAAWWPPSSWPGAGYSEDWECCQPSPVRRRPYPCSRTSGTNARSILCACTSTLATR